MRTMPTNLGGHCNNITPTPVLASMDPSCSSSMASTGSDRGGSTGGQPPVIYARVDHAAKRNNTNLCMLNQAQTTVPLLISNISGGSGTSAGGQPSLSGGGGVSPSSIMNTSCESSTSSGSASRLVFLFFLLGFFFALDNYA